MQRRILLSMSIAVAALIPRVHAEELRFVDLPHLPGLLSTVLNGEFGTTDFPPLADFTGHYYRVAGAGPTTVTFGFRLDEGAFVPDFGYYHVTPALAAIDTTTDAGRIAYAAQALAPGNVDLIFSDYRDSPPQTKTRVLNGGDMIGFFSIPTGTFPEFPFRSWLEIFQTHPERFALNGRDFDGYSPGDRWLARWPFFSYTPANPGGFDQMFSLHGTLIGSGNPSAMLLWEDASLYVDSHFPGDSVFYDADFNDEVYVIEGVVPVPEPNLVGQFAVLGAVLLPSRLHRRDAARTDPVRGP